jgi:DNA modification methylase
MLAPMIVTLSGDARALPLPPSTVDLIVTSPPYWRTRDYGIETQIGQEESPEEYVETLVAALREWRRVLRPTGSVFLNIGDTYHSHSLAGIPGLLEVRARQERWYIRNRIIWAKKFGLPSPAKNRLVNRHEYIYHLTTGTDYYYDLQGYAEYSGKTANPGDVWHIKFAPSKKDHLAPFPRELVERGIILACPEAVCRKCGLPRRRIVKRTMELDERRPQAKRAMEIAKQAGLTDDHIAAVQATGISDAGKAMKIQNGTGRNAKQVQKLAAEAKRVLGGYFREFTFAKKVTAGFTDCGCHAGFTAGVVLDPFCGSGTALEVAEAMNRIGIGVDLRPDNSRQFRRNQPSTPVAQG